MRLFEGTAGSAEDKPAFDLGSIKDLFQKIIDAIKDFVKIFENFLNAFKKNFENPDYKDGNADAE